MTSQWETDVEEGFAGLDVPARLRAEAFEQLRTWLDGAPFASYRPQLTRLIERKQWGCLLEERLTYSVATGNPLRLNITVGGLQMNPTNTSIFDLSPSEKLQLVEDLWDDLAATPEGRPRRIAESLVGRAGSVPSGRWWKPLAYRPHQEISTIMQ